MVGFDKKIIFEKLNEGDRVNVPKDLAGSSREVKATVVKKFPHHVLLLSDTGIRFCLTYYDCSGVSLC